MSKSGFIITEVVASGPGVADASVDLKPGLNLVSGASDTGKTYLFQALNYLLGGSKPPKAIPEATPYTTLRVGIKDREGNEYTLERPARGGNAKLFTGNRTNLDPTEFQLLSAQSVAGREDTISAFYLKLTALAGKRVRRNANGETNELSFRNLAHLNTIDEVRIYTEGSPVVSGQYTQKTLEQSVFKLLVTGEDDGNVTAQPGRTARRVGREATVAVLSELMGRYEEELRQLVPDSNVLLLETDEAQALVNELTRQVEAHRGVLRGVQLEREGLYRQRIGVESRHMLALEVLARFKLLEERYRSDISRHEAVAEAGKIFGQLPITDCPFCHANAEHQRHSDHQPVEDIATASGSEAEKLKILLADLQSTEEGTRSEAASLEATSTAMRARLDALDEQIEETLKPLVRSSQQEWIDLTERLTRNERGRWLTEQIAALSISRELPGALVETPAAIPQAMEDALRDLCAEIELTLRAWRFPAVGFVVYDPEAQDFSVAFRPRSTFGKGIRALIYSAFCVSLLRYCNNHDLPHPGFVILDSPLVAYREPDPGDEQLGPEVKTSFFDDLGGEEPDEQVIIFDNEDPPPTVTARMHHDHFSGTTGSGRFGFFPTLPGSASTE